MSKLRLSLACWNYDRTRALMDGTVQPDGIELNYLNLPVEETFFRMIRHREFDAAEMSLSSYTVSLMQPGAMRAAYRAHEMVYQAIAEHDADAAEARMRAHLRAVERYYWRTASGIPASA